MSDSALLDAAEHHSSIETKLKAMEQLAERHVPEVLPLIVQRLRKWEASQLREQLKRANPPWDAEEAKIRMYLHFETAYPAQDLEEVRPLLEETLTINGRAEAERKLQQRFPAYIEDPYERLAAVGKRLIPLLSRFDDILSRDLLKDLLYETKNFTRDDWGEPEFWRFEARAAVTALYALAPRDALDFLLGLLAPSGSGWTFGTIEAATCAAEIIGTAATGRPQLFRDQELHRLAHVQDFINYREHEGTEKMLRTQQVRIGIPSKYTSVPSQGPRGSVSFHALREAAGSESAKRRQDGQH
jgi:hypothetical protein